MSLQAAAQHLASRGRGPDTQLVHMAPQEVAGLQAIARAHGGSLTLNPETGLPEAGFLKKLLPTLIGFGIQATTGIPAWAIGLGVGGVETARTGSLGKGLMAGLGAYGGAGLGAGLNAAAATAGQGATAITAPAEGLASAGGQSMGQAANAIGGNLGAELGALNTGVGGVGGVSGLGGVAPDLGTASLGTGTGTGVGLKPMGQIGLSAPSGAAQGLTNIAPTEITSGANYAMGPKPLSVAPTTPEPSGFARVQSGLEALGTERGREAFIGQAASKGAEATGVGGYGGLAKYGLAALSPAMMGGEPAQYQGSGPNPFRYRYEQEMPEGPSADGSEERLQYVGRYVPYADGGPVQDMSDRNEALTLMANGGQQFAHGGISHLGDYSDGGRLLRGPGDGVSDSIPATIADKRPARLADGEFVVPARIVSELGNGSTEAGARKLYAMIDRVQNARKKSIGKKKVAVNSRADRALPA